MEKHTRPDNGENDPRNPEDFHGSKGEGRVFRALRTLPDGVVVIHSFRWLHPGNARKLNRRLNAQGEGDFVLVDPSRGIMVVEVKGGDVWCDDDLYHKGELSLVQNPDKTLIFRPRQITEGEVKSITDEINARVDGKICRFDQFVGLIETGADPEDVLRTEFDAH